MPENNSDLVKEIRETYDFDVQQWRKVRDEGRTDMRYLLGDPWDPEERKERKRLERMCISWDELHQYVNQLLNDVRQKKPGIKVMPEGNGANDKRAELREKRIRRIEYDSNAPFAYVTAFEGAVQRSYGCFGIGTRYKDRSFDQELFLRRIPNPDTVVFDWNCKELDCSDGDHATEIDYIPRATFERRFPKATKRSFTAADMEKSEGWVREKDIRIAGFWKVKKTATTLYLVETSQITGQSAPKAFTEEELKQVLRPGPVLDEREFEEREVCQYLTNGLEILKESPWAGQWVPLIPVFGRELYVDDGGGAERKLLSLVRLARDPFMAYCWIRTNMMECVAQAPKSLYLGYEGQFDGREDEWKYIHRSPTPYAQVKPMVDGATGQVLPLPRREQYDPPLQNLELFAEAARRSIQAAMGITPLPTAAQRRNEKSGVALEKIEQMEDEGTFHFVDNLNLAIRFAGIQVNDLLNHIEDTPRDVGVTERDGTHGVIRINDPEWQDPKTEQPTHHEYGAGDYGVTVSAGPSHQSEREEAMSFADMILPNIEQLPLDPVMKAKFVALVIRLRNLGPLGDAMAEILSPEQKGEMPPQAQALIAQGHAAIQQLQAKLQELEQERQAKLLELQNRRDIEKDRQVFELEMKKIDADTKKAVAEIGTKAQILTERMSAIEELLRDFHGSAHEIDMQTRQHDHEKQQADQAQAAAAEQQQAAQEQSQEKPEADPSLRS